VVTRTPFEQRRMDEARRKARKRAGIAALFAAPPALLAAVAFSPLLDVDTVRVTGNKRVAAAVVRNVGEARTGTPMVTVDTSAIRRRVAALPAVRRVTVTRTWPSTVTIHVVERVPVVAVHRPGRYDLYDIDGVLVETVTALPRNTPPLTVPGEPTRAVVTATVDLLRALPADLRGQVRDLRADGNGLLSFRLADGAEVVWGSAERTGEKVRVLSLLVSQHARRYDVRVPDRPAVLPRQP
jgi:cell division protein FtsQ